MVSATACGNFALAEAEITGLAGKRVLGAPPRPHPWHGAGAGGEEEEGCLSLNSHYIGGHCREKLPIGKNVVQFMEKKKKGVWKAGFSYVFHYKGSG